MNEELIDCPSCFGKGYKDDYEGVRLCLACDGCGYDLDSGQRVVLRVVERLTRARDEVKARVLR